MSVSAAFRSDHTARARPSAAVVFARHRGLLTAVAAFLLLFALVNSISAGHLSYFDISFMASGAATLAIAAIGETVVILTGGFDLSAGADGLGSRVAGNAEEDGDAQLAAVGSAGDF